MCKEKIKTIQSSAICKFELLQYRYSAEKMQITWQYINNTMSFRDQGSPNSYVKKQLLS